MKHLATLALITAAGVLTSQAALTDDLIAYYNFDISGAAGLTNIANPGTFHATFNGAGGGGLNASGTGFTGNAVFDGGDGLSNRPVLSPDLGGVLNLVDARGNFISTGISSVHVGNEFTISLWFALTPGAANNSDRYHVLESGDNFNISLGTNVVTTTTGPRSSYNYLGYINGTNNAQITAVGVSTGSWHHAAMVCTSGSQTLYIDGGLVGTFANGTGTNAFTNLLFGRERNNPDGPGDRDWDGMLEEVAVWNRSLTPAEVTGIRDLGLAGTPLVNSPTISLSSSPAHAGSTTGTGIYTEGAEVPVIAMANPGYVFSGWAGSFAGQPASFTYIANSSAIATAVFGEDTADNDGDGLSNYDEVVTYQTLPDHPDTDGDEIPDGDEINIIGTSPTVSDALMVDFVRQNLSPEGAGAVALSPLRIDRDPSSGAVSLFISLSGSADQSLWQDIDLSHPSVSILPAGDGWTVTFPAPSNTVNSFILLGSRP